MNIDEVLEMLDDLLDKAPGVPFSGKKFAVLVAIPQTEEEQSDPEIILARIETDESGEAEWAS